MLMLIKDASAGAQFVAVLPSSRFICTFELIGSSCHFVGRMGTTKSKYPQQHSSYGNSGHLNVRMIRLQVGVFFSAPNNTLSAPNNTLLTGQAV